MLVTKFYALGQSVIGIAKVFLELLKKVVQGWGWGGVEVGLTRVSANIIDTHLYNVIN